MVCFVQIFIYTTVYSKMKKKTFPYFPSLKLKNESETDCFLGLNNAGLYYRKKTEKEVII